jgi:hypothetical protein
MDDKPGQVIAEGKELPSFVKLAIAYLGIMAGMAAIGLVLYLIASRGEAPGSAPIPQQTLSITILFFTSLVVIPSISLRLLVKRRRVGGYLAFLALGISLFAPYSDPAFHLTITYWLAIPNAIVGILVWKNLKELY